jgi:hypothetical protein
MYFSVQPMSELLDWYHLKEHLYAVGGSLRRLEKAEKLLWEGDVEKVVSLFLSMVICSN